jgi:hypothetical protein
LTRRNAKRSLSRDLEAIPSTTRMYESSNINIIDEWGQKIIDRGELWKPLVPPPPPRLPLHPTPEETRCGSIIARS